MVESLSFGGALITLYNARRVRATLTAQGRVGNNRRRGQGMILGSPDLSNAMTGEPGV